MPQRKTAESKKKKKWNLTKTFKKTHTESLADELSSEKVLSRLGGQ